VRERSHKKGETYQKDAKHWLSQFTFLGLEAEMFGDAYDVTKKACTIGNVVFDFSLRLGRGDLARHILYAECKYRDEKKGNVNTDFDKFLRRVYDALLAAEADEAESAVFIFLSTVPPDNWRRYLNNKLRYCSERLFEKMDELRDQQILERIVQVVHVLVLSAPIIARA
jgi:hypothetical protein